MSITRREFLETAANTFGATVLASQGVSLSSAQPSENPLELMNEEIFNKIVAPLFTNNMSIIELPSQQNIPRNMEIISSTIHVFAAVCKEVGVEAFEGIEINPDTISENIVFESMEGMQKILDERGMAGTFGQVAMSIPPFGDKSMLLVFPNYMNEYFALDKLTPQVLLLGASWPGIPPSELGDGDVRNYDLDRLRLVDVNALSMITTALHEGWHLIGSNQFVKNSEEVSQDTLDLVHIINKVYNLDPEQALNINGGTVYTPDQKGALAQSYNSLFEENSANAFAALFIEDFIKPYWHAYLDEQKIDKKDERRFALDYFNVKNPPPNYGSTYKNTHVLHIYCKHLGINSVELLKAKHDGQLIGMLTLVKQKAKIKNPNITPDQLEQLVENLLRGMTDPGTKTINQVKGPLEANGLGMDYTNMQTTPFEGDSPPRKKL